MEVIARQLPGHEGCGSASPEHRHDQRRGDGQQEPESPVRSLWRRGEAWSRTRREARRRQGAEACAQLGLEEDLLTADLAVGQVRFDLGTRCESSAPST